MGAATPSNAGIMPVSKHLCDFYAKALNRPARWARHVGLVHIKAPVALLPVLQLATVGEQRGVGCQQRRPAKEQRWF
jgi:hypothetical protein